MEFVLSLFATAVFAAEMVLSPLADMVQFGPPPTPVPQPKISFGTIINTFIPLSTEASPAAILGATIATPSAEPIAAPAPTPITYQTRQKHYAIALLGDSMIDTLGADAPHLKRKLLALFPQTTFTILNYGVGATNIDAGFTRLTTGYSYLGEDKPALLSQSPDIIIVESFGYNPYPFEAGALDKHWLALASIVDTLKTRLPAVKVIIAATIAPNSQLFADGATGLNFTPEQKRSHTDTIKEYLDSTVKFAQSQDLPLADAYHPSLMANGDGNVLYINGGDHIHYSDAGRDLFAQKVIDTIIHNKLLE